MNSKFKGILLLVVIFGMLIFGLSGCSINILEDSNEPTIVMDRRTAYCSKCERESGILSQYCEYCNEVAMWTYRNK